MAERVDIEELERLAENAKPGPWRVDACKPNCPGANQCTRVCSPDGTPVGDMYSPRSVDDRALIVAMRNSLEALIAEVKAQRAALLAIHELAATRLEDESPGGDTLFEIERLSR